SLTLPAKEVYSTWQSDMEEQVLIQGVLDCVIPSDNGWILLDYKTDAINREVDEKLRNQLIKHYETTSELYKMTVETIWNQPVEQIYLYFFSKQLLINVPFDRSIHFRNKHQSVIIIKLKIHYITKKIVIYYTLYIRCDI